MKELSIGKNRIRYRDLGSGQAVVFLHGALANSHTWRKIAANMSHHFRCIMPDLPLGGHTLPFDPDTDLSPPGIAQVIDQFIDALGLDQVVLVGCDTGGAYAQIYSALHPEKIARLVLVNCDALDVFPPRQFASLPKAVKIPGYLLAMSALFRCRPFLKTSMALGLLSHALSEQEIHCLYVKSFIESSGVRRDFGKVARGWSAQHTLQAAAALSRFDKPVLLLWGSDDQRLFPIQLGRRLAAVFPQSRFETIDNALSLVQEDQPERFCALLLDFLLHRADVHLAA